MRRIAALLSVVTALLVVTAVAQANVAPSAKGDAYFTNSATDSVWMYATPPSGTLYYIGVRYYVNGVQTNQDTTPTFYGANHIVPTWAGTLTNGTTYQMCGTGYMLLSGTWFPDVPGTCDGYLNINTATTIDRGKPTVTNVGVEGSATYTNKTVGQTLALSGVYNDAISPPWPAAYTCVRTNADPATACNGATYTYQSGCSNAAAGSSTTNNPFSCTYPIQAGDPDGPFVFCAMVSDSSVPDNPANPDPYAGFTSSNANVSTPSCGYVVIDRTAPTLGISGGTTATASQSLTLSASATDPAAGITAGSGPSGSYTWSWGDNTAATTGATAAHTYAQAGTYTVTLSSGDAAGNAASTTSVITVAARSGTATGGTGAGTSSGSSGTVTAAPTASSIAAAVGTRSTQTQTAGGIDVLTARTVRIASKPKALPLAITAHQLGTATFTLTRNGRSVTQAGLAITKAGALGLRLKLPKRLLAGAYVLKVAFTPTGGAAARKAIGIRFLGAVARAAAAARIGVVPHLSGGAPAELGLGTPAADYGSAGRLEP